MRIAIHDADKEHLTGKGKAFPNYALMKISAWYKSKGDGVDFIIPIDPNESEQLSLLPADEYPLKRKAREYDIIYSSKVFDFTPENPYLPPDAIKGGTGYDITAKLPPGIDDCFPDYSLYPDCDYAIGYITRGCPNVCRHCVVPLKEGGIAPYRNWRQLVRPDTNKLLLMDNNILASQHGISELESLIGSGYEIDLNQGMDARLVTPEIADMIARLGWIKYIRFSCDTDAQVTEIVRVTELLADRGIRPYRIFIYMLVTADIEAAAARVKQLKHFKAINLYAQAERNERLGIRPTAEQLIFTQRYIYKGIYRKETWTQYRERTRGGN